MLISAVAGERAGRLRALVYLAAFLLPPGVTPPAVMRDDHESILMDSITIDRERGVSVVKPECARPVFYADCSEELASWATARLCPEPLFPPGLTAPFAEGLPNITPPRFYITCEKDRALGPAAQQRMYEALPCQGVYSLPAGHSPFLSMPERLAECLLDVAAQTADLAPREP
jgi:pimeloyl-ACP methyl ester carboxylesterase